MSETIMNITNRFSILSVIMIFLLLSAAYTDSHEKAEIYDYLLHWKVGSNFIEGNRFSSELAIVNESGTTLQGNWSLYFNLMRLADSESISSPLKLTHINGDFYRIDPTDQFDPLPPGDRLEFSFEAFGAAIKEIDAPDGAYFEFGDGRIVPVKIIVEPFKREEQMNRSPNDMFPIPTPEFVYEQNSSLSQLPAEKIGKIIPSPVSITENAESFTITRRTVIHYQQEVEREARFLAEALVPLLNTRLSIIEGGASSEDHGIQLSVGDIEVAGAEKEPGDRAYNLQITEGGIKIAGSDAAGVFYGIQSLRALIPPEVWASSGNSITVPSVTIEDAPGFEYRGMHLDVSRNFQSVETVKRLLDIMAFYKLNKFHFHLTDDEGWRLEIKAFPELTEVGGRRGHTHDESEHLIPSFGSGPDPDPAASMGGGWYTQDEYVDILRYAKERHIEVIPEIDVPGHARAALVAMKVRYDRLIGEDRAEEAERYRIHEPEDESVYMSVQRWQDNVINVCQESTYRFLGVVFDEIIEMHRSAGIHLSSIHIGADEVPHGVWVDSPKCRALLDATPDLDSVDQLQVWFFGRMKEMLEQRGVVMSGWEEIALVGYYGGEKELNPAFASAAIPYVWSNIWGAGTEGYSYKLANEGYKIVMCHASNFYFDFAYDKHPEEAGLYWAAFVDTHDPYGFIPFNLYKSGIMNQMGHRIPEDAYDGFEKIKDEAMNNILGLQAQLWGETFRSPERVEYMAVPRIMSLAERAWAPVREWMGIENRDDRLETLALAWNEFANRLGQRELPRLDRMNGGYGYRIPPPGAVIENGSLKSNVSYPGLIIRYTTDGSEPTMNSERYDGPVAVSGESEIRLRTFDTRGRGSRVITVRNY
jgi:hexosaminidase